MIVHGPYVSSNPDLLTVNQAAKILGVSGNLVRRLFDESSLTGLRIRRTVRIYRSSLDHYIKLHSNQPANGQGVEHGA